MDPLSAVSLAGTVLAFVDFSLKLASKAKETYSSASGSSNEEESLETVYATSSKCSNNLSTAVWAKTTTGGPKSLPLTPASGNWRGPVRPIVATC